MKTCYGALTLLIRFSVKFDRTAFACHSVRKYVRTAARVRVPRSVSQMHTVVHRTNRSVVAMVTVSQQGALILKWDDFLFVCLLLGFLFVCLFLLAPHYSCSNIIVLLGGGNIYIII